MRRTRRQHMPPDLTSLFDVLFIVIFAALIRAAASQQASAQPPAPPPKPAPKPLDPASLHARAVTQVDRDLAARDTVILRISTAGTVTALEHEHAITPLDTPLLEQSKDPDVALTYLGERSAELRLCRIAQLHLGTTDLAQQLVIFAPASALADLPHALYDGLRRDVERCLIEQHGLAVVVEP